MHENSLNYKVQTSAFKRKFVLYRKHFKLETATTPKILLKREEILDITKTIFVYMQSHPWIKYNINAALNLGQFDKSNGQLIGNDVFFSHSSTEMIKVGDIENLLKSVLTKCQEVSDRIEDILLRGSGWILLGIKFCDISITSLSQSRAYSNPKHASLKSTGT